MTKRLKIVLSILCCAMFFFLGWQVMPKIWPTIKEAIVYSVFPQMKPEPSITPEPYQPKSDISFGDPISASDSLIYYFYRDNCQFCRLLEALTAGLPEEIILTDGTRSDVKLVCLNKSNDADMKIIAKYYENHQIPEGRQLVPAIVIGNYYRSTRSEIIPHLLEDLLAGEGLYTPLLNGEKRTQ